MNEKIINTSSNCGQPFYEIFRSPGRLHNVVITTSTVVRLAAALYEIYLIDRAELERILKTLNVNYIIQEGRKDETPFIG